MWLLHVSLSALEGAASEVGPIITHLLTFSALKVVCSAEHAELYIVSSSPPLVSRRAHWAHLMSAALVSLDVPGAREMYDMLRGVYNPFRPNGSPPLPPLEEWRGMSGICEDTYCRYVTGADPARHMLNVCLAEGTVWTPTLLAVHFG